MEIRPLSIDGAWEVTPRQFGDPRGVFLEAFKADALQQATGRRLDLAQVNLSVSAAGTLRVVHFADVPPDGGFFVFHSQLEGMPERCHRLRAAAFVLPDQPELIVIGGLCGVGLDG